MGMRKQPWSNENKTERINFTIEPSLKEAFLKIISTDVSLFPDGRENESKVIRKKLKTGQTRLNHYCGRLRRSEQVFGTFNYRGRN